MSKKPAAKKKEFDDVELSDPELKEIENMKSDDDLNDHEEPEVDLDDLENEIHGMDDGTGGASHHPSPAQPTPAPTQAPATNTAQPKPAPAPAAAKPTLNRIQRESTYHGPENFFGNTMEAELEQVIPSLKKTCDEKTEEGTDFMIVLNKKEMDMLKMKMAVQKKVESGDITPEKYLDVLQKIHDKNKMVYQKATSEGAAKLDMTRISTRIETMAQEIKDIKESLGMADGSSHDAPVQPTPPAQPQPSAPAKPAQPAQPADKTKKPSPANDDFFPASTKQIPAATETKSTPQEVHPNVLYLAQKVTLYVSFLAYLQKYYQSEREADIIDIEKKVEKMKDHLEELKQDPSVADIQKLEKEFGKLEPSFIIGMDRADRNKRIEKIFQEINEDFKQVKSQKLIDIYKSNYQSVIKELTEIRDSPLAPFPVIKKKAFPVESNETNKNIDKGVLILIIKKILMPKADRYFYLDLNFKYSDVEFKEVFSYNDRTGNYNITKTFQLDEGKILKKFANESMNFTLHKKKYLFSSRTVASASYPLTKLKNYCTVPISLEFDYKDGMKLGVEMEIQINKALEAPMKDIYMYVIEKRIPAFTLPTAKREEAPAPAPTPAPAPAPQPKQPSSEAQKKPDVQPKPNTNSQPPPKTNPTPTPAAPKPADAGGQAPPPKSTFTSKYKFPLLVGQEKARLTAGVAKLKLDASYCNYHLSSFCVTFLEEFEKDVDTQMTEFCENGDTDGRKEAEQLTMKVSQYKNFLEKSLENGNMSQNDYKGKVEAFLQLDTQMLAFFEKNNFQQSAYFLKNRINILQTELNQLKEMGV